MVVFFLVLVSFGRGFEVFCLVYVISKFSRFLEFGFGVFFEVV